MIYTLTLSPAIDYFMNFEKDINLYQKTAQFEFIAGGKGINASILLQNLGEKPISLVVAGKTLGKKFEELVVKDKLKNLKTFNVDSETRVNVKANFQGRTYEMNSAGEKTDPLIINKDIKKYASEHFKKDDYLMIMGALPLEYKLENLVELIEHFQKLKVKLIFDLSQDYLKHLVQYRPEVIKPNRKELGEIFGVEIDSRPKAYKYAKQLVKLGAQRVIVSFDKDGAIYVDKDLELEVSSAKIKEVNGSGAGDSMLAGFTYGLLNKFNLTEALQLAAACGTATAASVGIADRKKINSYIKKIKVQGGKNA